MTHPDNFCLGCQIENPNPSVGIFTDKDGNYLGLMPTCRSCGRPVGPRVDDPNQVLPIKDDLQKQHHPSATVPTATSHGVRVSQQQTLSIPLPAQPTGNLTPKTLLKQAKARVKELDRFLKECRKLEQEREELKRLILAAKSQKPRKPMIQHRVQSVNN